MRFETVKHFLLVLVMLATLQSCLSAECAPEWARGLFGYNGLACFIRELRPVPRTGLVSWFAWPHVCLWTA